MRDQTNRSSQSGLDEWPENQLAIATAVCPELERRSNSQASLQQGFQRDHVGNLVSRLDELLRQIADPVHQSAQCRLRPECSETKTLEILPGERAASAGERMICAAEQPDLIFNERPIGQFRDGLEIAAEAEIRLAVAHSTIDGRLVLLTNVNADVRVGLFELLQNSGKNPDDE